MICAIGYKSSHVSRLLQNIIVLKSLKSLVFKALKVGVLSSKFKLPLRLYCPVEKYYHVSVFLFFLSHSVIEVMSFLGFKFAKYINLYQNLFTVLSGMKPNFDSNTHYDLGLVLGLDTKITPFCTVGLQIKPTCDSIGYFCGHPGLITH